MKILFIHNSYSEKNPSGEEYASQELASLLEEHGHEVRWFKRNSDEVRGGFGPIKAFFSGIYNPFSAKALTKVLDDFKPDIIQVQNIYPLLSSSIFKPIKRRGIPVVMRCPNYRLFCPNGLCLSPKDKVCEKCFGGKEWNCILYNCEKSLLKSIGYALRGWYSRVSRNILDSVVFFIVQSEFQKKKFKGQGIDESQITILPGIAPNVHVDEYKIGEYCAFVGRVSAEKGIYDFIDIARRCPEIPFKVAGKMAPDFVIPKEIPLNLEFVGFLKGKDLDDFYQNSKIVVVPSKWYEGFPNVILRAMMHKKPVISYDIGAMPEIVRVNNGVIIKTGDLDCLADAVITLYNNNDRCRKLGEEGFENACDNYSKEIIYNQLINIYYGIKGFY